MESCTFPGAKQLLSRKQQISVYWHERLGTDHVIMNELQVFGEENISMPNVILATELYSSFSNFVI